MQFSSSASLDGISRHCSKIPPAELLCGSEASANEKRERVRRTLKRICVEKSFESFVGSQLKGADLDENIFIEIHSEGGEARKICFNYVIGTNRCGKIQQKRVSLLIRRKRHIRRDTTFSSLCQAPRGMVARHASLETLIFSQSMLCRADFLIQMKFYVFSELFRGCS